MKDGRVLNYKSEAESFLADQLTKEDRLENFYSQALLVQTREKSEKILELVEKLEDLNDIRPVVELLAR